MFQLLLPFGGSMTVQTSNALGSVLAHLELMYDGRRFAQMAFGTFSDSAGLRRGWLPTLDPRTVAVDNKCRYDERRRNYDRNKHASKRHRTHSARMLPDF